MPIFGKLLTNVSARARRITHVVEAVEETHEVVGAGEGGSRRNVELDPIRQSRVGSPLPRRIDRTVMGIETNNGRCRIGLREQQGRRAVPTSDIGDPAPRLQLRLDTFEGWDPRAGEEIEVAGLKKRSQPPSTCPSCAPQANPSPVRNRSAMVSVA